MKRVRVNPAAEKWIGNQKPVSAARVGIKWVITGLNDHNMAFHVHSVYQEVSERRWITKSGIFHGLGVKRISY